jgi:F-type H+-transporting ATPase subunit delta
MSVTNSYGRALYEIATESKQGADFLDQIEKQLDSVTSLLQSSREARIALEGPLTTAQEKATLVGEFSKKLNLSPIVTQFVAMLAKNGRIRYLHEIKDTFRAIRLNAEGGVAGHLVTAEPVSEADVTKLSQVFSEKLGKRISFRVSTDPTLLAGMKVTVNGVTYDGTLRSQFQKLRDRFVAGLSGPNQ